MPGPRGIALRIRPAHPFPPILPPASLFAGRAGGRVWPRREGGGVGGGAARTAGPPPPEGGGEDGPADRVISRASAAPAHGGSKGP